MSQNTALTTNTFRGALSCRAPRSAVILAAMLVFAGACPVAAQLVPADSIEIVDPADTTSLLSLPFFGDDIDSSTTAVSVRYDSSDIHLREPSSATLDEYRSDNDFVYDRIPRDSESLFQKILRWLLTQFRRLLGGAQEEATFWVWFFRVLAVTVIVYVVLKLANSDLRSMFLGGSERKVTGMMEVDENIHEMNFDDLIEQAVADGNYRRGVRLLYLRALKQLNDRELINWRRDKTNHEYLRELRTSHLQGPFADATWLFEYVWYGDQPVNETRFRSIRETFSNLSSSIARNS